MSASSDMPVTTADGGPLTSAEHPMLLFFDGDCSFCARWVERVKRADTRRRIRFATKQGPTFQRVAQAHPEVANVDSVVLVARNDGGREEFLAKSPAIHKLIEGLPGFRFFSLVLDCMPTPISNLGYSLFARLREPLFSRWHDDRPPIEADEELFVD